MGSAPLPDAFDLGGAGEVITVGGLGEPAPLAGGFARLAAGRSRAVALAPDAPRVGRKEGLTVLTRALTQWTFHGPASPQVHDYGSGAGKEENGTKKQQSKQRGRTRKKGINISSGEEDGTAEPTISPWPCTCSFRSPLTESLRIRCNWLRVL